MLSWKQNWSLPINSRRRPSGRAKFISCWKKHMFGGLSWFRALIWDKFCYLSASQCAHPQNLGMLILSSLELLWRGMKKTVYKSISEGLLWQPSGEESVLVCRGHRFDPWSGKIPHWCRTNKPVHHNYRNSDALESVLHNKRSHRDEKPAHSN